MNSFSMKKTVSAVLAAVTAASCFAAGCIGASAADSSGLSKYYSTNKTRI